jgi:hypothetical protein
LLCHWFVFIELLVILSLLVLSFFSFHYNDENVDSNCQQYENASNHTQHNFQFKSNRFNQSIE